jgi:hypothetical protein
MKPDPRAVSSDAGVSSSGWSKRPRREVSTQQGWGLGNRVIAVEDVIQSELDAASC